MVTTIKDKATGIEFPWTFTAPGLPKALTALGVGVREKNVLLVPVHVYAIAAHVDAEAAKAALSAFKGKGNLGKDEAFFSALQEGAYEVSLTMCFARDITHAQFSSGIKESMDPLMKAKNAPKELMPAWINSLSGLSYSAGSRVYLTLLGDRVVVAGAKKADVPANLSAPASVGFKAVESPILVSVLKEVYFGKNSVAESLRASLAEGASSLLK